MSDQPHARDRRAAFTGLLLGALALGVIVYTIVRLTNAHFEGTEGAKPAASATR